MVSSSTIEEKKNRALRLNFVFTKNSSLVSSIIVLHGSRVYQTLPDFTLRRLLVIVFLAPIECANEEEETKRIPKWFLGIYFILV